MKRTVLLLALCALARPASAATVDYFWNNSGTDMNSASSYSRVDTGAVSRSRPSCPTATTSSGSTVSRKSSRI